MKKSKKIFIFLFTFLYKCYIIYMQIQKGGKYE